MANHVGATERAYLALKEGILSGKYPPADSLLEIDLAKEYSVSRASIKKAILMLETEGLVITEANKSAKVRYYSLKEVLDYLEFRELLEGYICRIATPAFTENDVLELEGILSKMKAYKDSRMLIEYSSMNQQFHAKIYSVCPNRTATNVTTALKNQMKKYNAKTIFVPGRVEESYKEHCNIFLAIKAGDADAAAASMTTHVSNLRKTFHDNSNLIF